MQSSSNNHNAVLDGIGKVVDGEAQFAQGAQHAVGFNAPQLSLVDFFAAGQGRVVQWLRGPQSPYR